MIIAVSKNYNWRNKVELFRRDRFRMLDAIRLPGTACLPLKGLKAMHAVALRA
jgi:hypothetical protein